MTLKGLKITRTLGKLILMSCLLREDEVLVHLPNKVHGG